MMDECEALVNTVARRNGSKEEILIYQGKEIKLAPPWPRMSVSEAFEKLGSIPLHVALERGQFDEIMVERNNFV